MNDMSDEEMKRKQTIKAIIADFWRSLTSACSDHFHVHGVPLQIEVAEKVENFSFRNRGVKR